MLHGNPLCGRTATVRTAFSLRREGVVAVAAETPGVGGATGRDVVQEQLEALREDTTSTLRCVDG
jgi:hypothetical protein